MLARGLEPEFSPAVEEQVRAIAGPARDPAVADLRSLPWCSIDNHDSRDLDQITVAVVEGEATRILVAIADVDPLVERDSPIDRHAAINTTSVYTPAVMFPMLPPRLSTDLTSLNEGEDRLALVVDMVVADDGSIPDSSVYHATVRNQVQLAYGDVGAWLEGEGSLPSKAAALPGMDEQLRVQSAVARRLCERRHEDGALELESIEPRARFDDQALTDLSVERKNRARQLIEDFMIAANGVTTRLLTSRGYPTFRRVVREPERWPRIVNVARDLGEHLPPDPDSRALAGFLARRRRVDPVRFPDLSLVIVKLMGAGEYVVQRPGGHPLGHFGLAVRDYSHSTAPNRRYPDLVTHRLVRAALAGQPAPYSVDELETLAEHCTDQEDDANRVERQMRKSAAAMLLSGREGERFEGVVTGASSKGTWARAFQPPVEGKVVRGSRGLEVGDRVTLRLLATDVEAGFIDFAAG